MSNHFKKNIMDHLESVVAERFAGSKPMNREETDLVFQPTTMPGEYHLYYLPFTGSKKSNYPKITYPKQERAAEKEWLWRNYLAEQDLKLKSWTVLSRARVVAFEAIDSLNSFWPMEVIATRGETETLAAAHPTSSYLVFPEDRHQSIVMERDLPLRDIEEEHDDGNDDDAEEGQEVRRVEPRIPPHFASEYCR